MNKKPDRVTHVTHRVYSLLTEFASERKIPVLIVISVGLYMDLLQEGGITFTPTPKFEGLPLQIDYRKPNTLYLR